MFIDFIFSAYRYTVPVLLLSYFFIKGNNRNCLLNAIAVSNILLIIYCSSELWQIINFLRTAFTYKHEGYTSYYSRFNLFSPYGHLFYAMLLAMIVPFLFLFKKMKANKWLVLVELFLLWWSDVWRFLQNMFRDYLPSSWSVNYDGYNLPFQVLNYLSLFIGTYALLWLLKKLPSQQAEK